MSINTMLRRKIIPCSVKCNYLATRLSSGRGNKTLRTEWWWWKLESKELESNQKALLPPIPVLHMKATFSCSHQDSRGRPHWDHFWKQPHFIPWITPSVRVHTVSPAVTDREPNYRIIAVDKALSVQPETGIRWDWWKWCHRVVVNKTRLSHVISARKGNSRSAKKWNISVHLGGENDAQHFHDLQWIL